MKIVNLAFLLSLISWPIICILIFFLFIRSSSFLIPIVCSVGFGGFPSILAICLVYPFYFRQYIAGKYRNTKIDIIIPEFSNVNEVMNEINEKQSELISLKRYPFQSFIVDIQKKNLKKEIKLLKKQLLRIKKSSS
ncbi:MAG: hypothetical protein ACFFDF_04195 [Candidatus Odinarchaeota archaeon]